MNSKIVEYKQRYYEIDNEVEGELIITQNRNNVVLDFLNNYPELWEIIYKYKEQFEKQDRHLDYIRLMEWEINWLNSLSVNKLVKVINDTWGNLPISNSDWTYYGNTQYRFRLRVFLEIQKSRCFKNGELDDKTYELKDNYKRDEFIRINQFFRERETQFNIQKIFSNKTLRKRDGVIQYNVDLERDSPQFKNYILDTLIDIQTNEEDFNTNMKKDIELLYPYYGDIIKGKLINGQYPFAKPRNRGEWGLGIYHSLVK